METIKQKRQRVYFLMKNNHLLEAKEHILSGYGVEQIRELSEEMADELIGKLEEIERGKQQEHDKELRQWRHKVLRVMNEFMDTNDWNKVNRFMMDKRVAGKHLYECSVEELKVLHRKINKIKQIYESKRDKLQSIAIQN